MLIPPPEGVSVDLARLRLSLDADLPGKALDRNLLIATWDVRAFGGLIEEWESSEDDTPKRDLHSLPSVVEIVSRFDIVAIQEAREDLKALRHMLKALGPNWGLSLTDVTEGAPGNGERMAFLFDTRRVVPSGLACELVVPQEELYRVDADALRRQFARTPYAAGATRSTTPSSRRAWTSPRTSRGPRARSSPIPSGLTWTSSTTRSRGSSARTACPRCRCATRAGASSTSPNPP